MSTQHANRGVSTAESSRRKRVRAGESQHTAIELPLLTVHTPACGPLWRLFDGTPLPPPVRRQARALCPRCGLNTECEGMR